MLSQLISYVDKIKSVQAADKSMYISKNNGKNQVKLGKVLLK